MRPVSLCLQPDDNGLLDGVVWAGRSKEAQGCPPMLGLESAVGRGSQWVGSKQEGQVGPLRSKRGKTLAGGVAGPTRRGVGWWDDPFPTELWSGWVFLSARVVLRRQAED